MRMTKEENRVQWKKNPQMSEIACEQGTHESDARTKEKSSPTHRKGRLHNCVQDFNDKFDSDPWFLMPQLFFSTNMEPTNDGQSQANKTSQKILSLPLVDDVWVIAHLFQTDTTLSSHQKKNTWDCHNAHSRQTHHECVQNARCAIETFITQKKSGHGTQTSFNPSGTSKTRFLAIIPITPCRSSMLRVKSLRFSGPDDGMNDKDSKKQKAKKPKFNEGMSSPQVRCLAVVESIRNAMLVSTRAWLFTFGCYHNGWLFFFLSSKEK